jgi:hypothetical protein
VRGAGGGKNLSSNTTAAEGTVNAFPDADYGFVSSFDSGGFSVNDGAVATTGGYVNYSGRTYVAWNWKANGSGASNSAGSITSTVSANTTSGFSVVTYTGTGANATVGHGIGIAPRMIIVKRRNGVDIWPVYHESIGNTQYLRLQGTNPAGTFNVWQNTSPTSSVFYISTDSTVNTSGGTYVAYCFAEVAGYSAFGSYTGNASADGPFIYTGFRPAYIMLKRTDTVGYDWYVFDTKRNTYNLTNASLYPDLSAVEGVSSVSVLDILSNGFKMRGSSGGTNPSSGTMIYAAFAENPFKYSLAR